jgi:hypothetical protein
LLLHDARAFRAAPDQSSRVHFQQPLRVLFRNTLWIDHRRGSHIGLIPGSLQIGRFPDILCCRKSSVAARFGQGGLNPFDCSAGHAVWFAVRGRIRTMAMIETVTAFFGVVSVGIFLAHALEGFLSRP